jgi:IS30 family transposase
VPAEDKAAIERMLAERLSLRAIARITGRSRSWLQGLVNEPLRERTPHTPGRLKKRPAA